MPATRIRASALPSYPDCARRSSARLFPDEVKAAGFDLRETESSVGASIGTAVHAAAAFMLTAKMHDGVIPDLATAQDVAVTSLRESTAANGTIWDDTTPHHDAAIAQLGRMVAVYRQEVAPRIKAARVETFMAAPLGKDGGFNLTGHADALLTVPADEPDDDPAYDIDDLKTGALARPYQAQLGAYSLLARSQPEPYRIRKIRMTFIRRAPRTKPQPLPVVEYYDRGQSERAAWEIAHKMKSDLEQFRETGNPWAFTANPLSLMCSDKWCPAWGTKYCSMWRKK